MKKFNIFAGNYGSGKTEISLNLALMAARQKKRVLLVDMDIVNPYFRAGEHQKLLNDNGVDIIMPKYANTMIDSPSLPPEIYRPFDDTSVDFAVYDAGGDPVGAAALGMLKDRLEGNALNYNFYYVINTMRPLQAKVSYIIEMMQNVERASNIEITGIVNNTNIALETTSDMVVEGERILEEVSSITKIPIVFTTVMPNIAEEVRRRLPGKKIVEISIYTRPEWL